MKTLATFLVAAVLCLWFAAWGLFAAGGRDIGFAGGGIWFLFLPGALLALAIVSIASRFTHWPEDPLLQRAAFVGSACALAFCFGAAPIGLFRLGAEREARATMVYAPAPGFRAELAIELPAEATVGAPVAPAASMKQGPWQRITYKELIQEPQYKSFATHFLTQAPPAIDTGIVRRLTWWSDPPQPGDKFDMRPDPFPGAELPPALIFRAPGTYRVWATSPDPVDTKSNVVSVTVRAPEYVFVPAADYRTKLEIQLSGEVVTSERVAAKAILTRGPWERIAFGALKEERYRKFARHYALELPLAVDEAAAVRVAWYSKPDASFNALKPEPGARERTLVFLGAGTYEVRAATWEESVSTESNVVTVRVRDK